MKQLGLYLHIPFCRSKCAYCDFYSLPGREGQMERYCAALLRELAHWGERAEGYCVDTVYFGGGTPSWFGAERLAAVLDGVRTHFAMAEGCEITVEVNPDSVTPEGLSALYRAGVNRLSMGVQSAAESELRQAGRPHSFAQAVQAFRWAREVGFRNISLDLIYGLPGQTQAQWQSNVEQVLALAPEHLSCYGLKIEEGTPFARQRESLDLPDEDAQADAYLWLCERLGQAGFVQYEISNFARPGYPSRHNRKYWRLEEYLGLGPAAHSDFRGVRFGYVRDLEGYISGDCALAESHTPTPEERLEEYIMLGLRTGEGICEEGYRRYGGTEWATLHAALRQLERHALVREQAGHWSCTAEGYLVNNAIIGALLD